ncbi:MAG: bifunctional pyr operon transcriptional regulator/uracil phosphoribosyltransferase PyrR [Pseudomonadota bacterium]|jgi:pyrimidine operon attenuation protein/uracil phosphoribosyltransferase
MNAKFKPVPREWQQVMDEETISRAISRMSFEIVEKDRDLGNLAVVGIRTGGEYLAKRLQQEIQRIEGVEVAYGVIDITLYRDDLLSAQSQPTLRGTDLPFRIAGSRIVLVDDVLFTGRTIRSALDAIIDFGRPKTVELAVLVDRGHRELPIQADYIGKTVACDRSQLVRVRLREMGYQDGAYLINRDDR